MAHISCCLEHKSRDKMAVAVAGSPEVDDSRAGLIAVPEAGDFAGIDTDQTIAAQEEIFVVCCSRVDLDSLRQPKIDHQQRTEHSSWIGTSEAGSMEQLGSYSGRSHPATAGFQLRTRSRESAHSSGNSLVVER
jgi:hypothetical protein